MGTRSRRDGSRDLGGGNIAVYDTLFVELAEREEAPLVTFDRRLLKNWPAIACRPAQAAAR